MQIRRLQIENFRAIRQQGISFFNALDRVRPITVLAGPNGCGKTSLLFAIVQALRGALRARVPDIPLPSDDDLHRAEPTGRRPVTALVHLDLEYDQRELDAIQKAFDATRTLRERTGKAGLHPPALTDGRLSLEWQYPPRLLRDGTLASPFDLRSDPDFGAVWLNGPSAAWRGWKNRLIDNVTDMYPIGMLRVFPQDRDRRWGIDIDESEGDTDPLEKNLEPTVSEALRRLGEWAHGQGISETDDRRQWEQQLQARFERICGPKRYLGYWLDHPRYGETPLLSDQGRQYPFRSAASGELVVMHYLTKFTFPRPVHNSIILIDEPELHLHPRWIRQLYRALGEMAKAGDEGGNNNQFIMTTHSPELRQLAAEDNALIDLGALGEPTGSAACA